ncbi:MAG: phage head completion protein [Brevundimonas sp.]
MPSSSTMRDSVTFQRRGLDANGDPLGPWESVMTVAAEINWLRGSETALQSRIEGVQPVAMAIRDSAQAREINGGWRVINARNTAQQMNITAVAPSPTRGFIDVLATLGGATG